MNPDDLEPVLFAGLDGNGINTGLIRVTREKVKEVESKMEVEWSGMFYLWENPNTGNNGTAE